MARPKTMATRKLISLPAGMAEAVNDYWHRHKLQSESEAIRVLLELGLGQAGAKTTAPIPPHSLVPPAIDAATPITMPSSVLMASPAIAARLAEHPYPAQTIAGMPEEAIKDLGARISARLKIQIDWLAKLKGRTTKDEITEMLKAGFTREIARLKIKT